MYKNLNVVQYFRCSRTSKVNVSRTRAVRPLACVVKQRKAVVIVAVPSEYKIVITRALGMYGINFIDLSPCASVQ